MNKITLLDIFLVFAKIGAFTIGGGYVMIPAIEEELKRRKWLSDEELPDMVALSQSAPGLLTVNMAIFSGYKMRGVAGSIVATLGAIAAPVAVILLIATLFNNFSDNPWVIRVFKGVRPVAVALIAGYFIKLLRRNTQIWKLAITLAVLLLMVFLEISAVYIILATIVIALAFALSRQGRDRK